MKRRPAERFRLEVRLMAEPCLWCWEIRDTVDGHVVESSWSDAWMAYDSSEDALTAANSRLRELDRPVPGKVTRKAGAPARAAAGLRAVRAARREREHDGEGLAFRTPDQ